MTPFAACVLVALALVAWGMLSDSVWLSLLGLALLFILRLPNP